MVNLKEFKVDKGLILITMMRRGKFMNRTEGMVLRNKLYKILKNESIENIKELGEKCLNFTNHPELFNDTILLERLKPVFETNEFQKLYNETLKYRDDVINRWNFLQPEVKKYFSHILGINEEKDIVVNIVNPYFNTGTNNMNNEIFWGHYVGINNPNYDAVYMMHESMHCMFPYKKEWNRQQRGICHSLIELATDNELMCRLSGDYKEYNMGHYDGAPIRKKLMPLWCAFLSEKPGRRKSTANTR